MEIFIGAGLLAAGLLLSRVFDHFWPSKEAQRERQAAVEREEREARRQYRSELAKPIIAALDRAAAFGEMRTIVSTSRADNGPPVGSEDMARFEEQIRSMPDAERTQLLADDLKKLFLDETPLIYRLDDGVLRYLVLKVLVNARSGPRFVNENHKNLTEAYHSIGRWIATSDTEEVAWASEGSATDQQ